MLAGCLLAKTAKFTITDLNVSLEYTLMAARLLTCVFECDVAHPQRPCDFATYTPTYLWPGVDIFADRYRCNSRATIDALEFIGMELTASGYFLEALPVLAMYEHVARDTARSVTHTVHARLLRAKALSQLGFLSETYQHLRNLQLGEGLPKVASAPPVSTLGTSSLLLGTMEIPPFSNSLPSSHERNLRALQVLADTILVCICLSSLFVYYPSF